MVFALSPALSRILLMVSVRATFHYQSSIMWRPPAGPPGRHLCQVRSTTRPVCGQAEQFSTNNALIMASKSWLLSPKDRWVRIWRDWRNRGGLWNLPAEEGLTGRGSGWTPRKQLLLAPPASAAPAVVTPACTSSASIFKHVSAWKSSVKSLLIVPDLRRFSRAIYPQFCCHHTERWKEMKGVQPHNVGLEVAGMLCTALPVGHYPLHTGRKIFLSLRSRKTMVEHAMNNDLFECFH